MSLLSRNELQIALYPERISWDRSGRELTLHGFRHDVRGRGIVCCEVADEEGAPWLSVIRTLEAALPSLIEHKTDVNVILSNQFVQYILVPWMDKLSDEEEMVFAQHCFRDMFGSAADSWSVRVSPGRAGAATLASAVDTRLLEELRGLIGRMNLGIKSIQPHLMAVYNSCRASLEGRSAWFALMEPGNLCLLLQHKGQLAWVRKMRIGDAWHGELSTILERETYLVGAEAAIDDVLLWTPHLDDTDIPSVGRWNIQYLKPGGNFGQRLKYSGQHTLAAEEV